LAARRRKCGQRACLRGEAFFGIFFPMKLDINPRGNGACPLCRSNEDCRLKQTLARSLSAFKGMEMEIVIYQCAQFTEKA
jgi:hypothetical protein